MEDDGEPGPDYEKIESKRVARGTEVQCSTIQLNGLIQVRLDAPLLEFIIKVGGTVVKGFEFTGRLPLPHLTVKRLVNECTIE